MFRHYTLAATAELQSTAPLRVVAVGMGELIRTRRMDTPRQWAYLTQMNVVPGANNRASVRAAGMRRSTLAASCFFGVG